MAVARRNKIVTQKSGRQTQFYPPFARSLMGNDSVRVIVVDDFCDEADTLAELLSFDGYKVCAAYDGNEALAKIPTFAPHCILFDIDMPGLDGFQMAKQIRVRYGDKIMLVAFTARPLNDPQVPAAFSVADHYLMKPIDPAKLRRLLPPHGSPPVTT